MQKAKILLGIIVVLSIGLVVLLIFEQDTIASYVRPIILPLLAVLYCSTKKEKSSSFFYFILFYALAEFSGLFSYFARQSSLVDNLMYYGGNTLYITAYIFLIMEVLKAMDVKNLINRFFPYILILVVLDIYSVILVSDITFKSDNFFGSFDHVIEVLYNTVIMLLLTVTLINYISQHTKKAMNLLLGALCIVFSEVIQVAYFYVSAENILGVIYSLLLVLAFTFFYIQSNLSYVDDENYETLENLEA